MENFFVWIAGFLTWFGGQPVPDSEVFDLTPALEEVTVIEKATLPSFSRIGLKTNTNKHSIPLEEVLDGGPRKDGIPALFHPEHWDDVATAKTWLNSANLGVLYEHNGTKKYYPYDLLYWHEIVNDVIDDHYFSVTFCPLCGSVVVYDRVYGETRRTFGVSGKLWESNLLMYDRETETLWSQIIGDAVVGDLTGAQLRVLPSNILTFEEVLAHHPEALVLNTDTGFNRRYGASPYGDYEVNEDLVFPVSDLDDTFHPKEIFYVIDFEGQSVGFHLKDLKQAGEVFFYVKDKKLKAEYTDAKQIVVTSPEGKVIPGYFAMWFSWMTHQKAPQHFWHDRQN